MYSEEGRARIPGHLEELKKRFDAAGQPCELWTPIERFPNETPRLPQIKFEEVDDVYISNLVIEEQSSGSSWRSRPNGVLYISYGEYGDRKMFRERKADKTFDYDAIVEYVIHKIKRRFSSARMEARRRVNVEHAEMILGDDAFTRFGALWVSVTHTGNFEIKGTIPRNLWEEVEQDVEFLGNKIKTLKADPDD